MRIARVFYQVGKIIIIVGLAMFVPMICSLIYGEQEASAFAVSIPVCLLVGFLLLVTCHEYNAQTMRRRDSFLFVTMAWLSAAFFGALPFYISGAFPDFASCFFESMSGFTTTGATAFSSVEAQSNGILLWRSFSQWIGGAGIILIFVALIQRSPSGDDRGEGNTIFKAEYSGAIFSQRVSPKIENNAKAIFLIYLGLTVLCLGFLLLGKMNGFDAVNHAMTVIATGGFSTKDLSIEAFNSAYIEWVVLVFICLSGLNYALMYLVFVRRKWEKAWQNQELRLYFLILLVATLVLAVSLYINNYYPGQGFGFDLRKGAFQAATIITTAGFSSADYGAWPNFAVFFLFCLMMVGGCAGSTSGSIKIHRWFVAVKGLSAELLGVSRPKAVHKISYNKKMLSEETTRRMLNFFFFFIGMVFLGSMALTWTGLPWVEALGAAVSALANVGPAIGSLGPAGNFAEVSIIGKWIISFLMLVGRLEIYTVLVLFIPLMWRK